MLGNCGKSCVGWLLACDNWLVEDEGENVRKIVVFDSGWGGELVADYLTQELGVVEVVRVIDWSHQVYNGVTLNIEAAAKCLAPYAGKVDLIVLAGYTVGMMLWALRRLYPEQNFVAPTINYDKMLRARQYPEKVAVLMSDTLKKSTMFQELREKLPYSTLILPECANWEDLIDSNLMTREVVRTELAWDFELCGERSRRAVAKARSPRVHSTQFSPLEILSEKSLEKRALMKAIQNFGSAAEQVEREEDEAVAKVVQEQREVLAADTGRRRMRPDLVLLLNTHFWEIKPEIERSLGWQTRVLDFRETLLRDVCTALKLKGVDGKRSK